MNRKATLEDFQIVDKLIDLLAPEYESRYSSEIRKARRAWGRILLTFGDHKRYMQFFDLEKKIRLLKKAVIKLENEPVHEGFPPSYRYMEGWLDGVRFVLEEIRNILEEE